MSALTGDPNAFAPLAVLAASLLGSGHCVAMCGGLNLIFARTRGAAAFYHAGRLLCYVTLGALSGALGNVILRIEIFPLVSWGTTMALSVVLLGVGIQRFRGRPLHFSLPAPLSSFFRELWPRSSKEVTKRTAFTAGLLTGLLPCGWLYSFVLAAAVTQSVFWGGLCLLLFWMGSLPALGSFTLLFPRLGKPVRDVSPKASGLLLVAAALFTVLVRAGFYETPRHSKVTPVESPEVGKKVPCPFHR